MRRESNPLMLLGHSTINPAAYPFNRLSHAVPQRLVLFLSQTTNLKGILTEIAVTQVDKGWVEV